MKFLEVNETDMRLFAQVINMLQVGEYKVNGKDVCAASDAIRWLQKAAVLAAESYANASKNTPVESDNVPPPPPSGGLPEGVNMKAFNPGKIGRK